MWSSVDCSKSSTKQKLLCCSKEKYLPYSFHLSPNRCWYTRWGHVSFPASSFSAVPGSLEVASLTLQPLEAFLLLIKAGQALVWARRLTDWPSWKWFLSPLFAKCCISECFLGIVARSSWTRTTSKPGWDLVWGYQWWEVGWGASPWPASFPLSVNESPHWCRAVLRTKGEKACWLSEFPGTWQVSAMITGWWTAP